MNGLSKDSASHYAVDEAGAGQRVDNFLRRLLKGVPKSHIYRILRNGEGRVNKKEVRPGGRLGGGDDLRIPPVRPGAQPEQSGRMAAPPIEPSILFEDDAL